MSELDTVAPPAAAGASRNPTASVAASERGAARTGVTAKHIALLAHRYVGLLMTVFLFVAGITGSVIVFYHELDEALNPALYHAPPPTPGAPLLDPLVLRERLQAKLPSDNRALFAALEQKPGHAQEFFIQVPPAQKDTADDQYFVNPYDGAVIGSRHRGDLTQGVKNLMPFLYRLHYSLGLGEVGSYMFGICALLWTVDCFVGAYLTFPASSRTRAKKPGRSWLARWKPAWLLKATKLFSLVFSWHRASGLWVWVMLLVFAWSAVALNLREVYDPVMNVAFAMPLRADQRIPALPAPRLAPQLSWDQARARARQLMAERAEQDHFTVLAERRLQYNPPRGAYRYLVRSTLDVSDRYANTTVIIDGDSGKLLAFEAPTGQNAGRTVTTWLYQLHFGSVAAAGWPYRIFVFLMGFAVALLSVTGVWIWWKKRDKRPGTRRGRGPRAGAAQLLELE
ncbi:MAG: PepSY-associated TM helix domain-containing protein [Polyangiales bacterium]